MNRLGFKSVVYHGDVYLGELETIPLNGNFRFPNNEIRIHHLTPSSERCHPLSVLQTVSSASVHCKLEPGDSSSDQSQLINLYASCFYDLKTAVMLLGNEEFHLVAMPSNQQRFPCFWCYSVPIGVYSSCLWMLNTRCLAIVFDLDETLIVANTMKSIDNMIDSLLGRIEHETDPIQESGMTAEMKRYVMDREILKQYAEADCVMDGGKMYKTQEEEVPLLSGGSVVRPVIRLPERNIVLTRINPENRDTSMLVRLRLGWEELKNYLTARGRKRFDVYVCTMAERDYALEMWRLLDPDAHLISAKQLLDRVVCVKSGAKKSLHNVFRNGNGHPKMAMAVDDRLKVWVDEDQPRVHVVPHFTPYYAPQAEITKPVPVLCLARNVLCNVRGGFFKDFDENLLPKISEIFYEDEIVNLPHSPDVSNFLMSEGDNLLPNGNPSIPIAEGLNGPEVAQRLEEKNVLNFVSHPMPNNIESKPESSMLPAVPVASAAAPAHTRVKNEQTNLGNDSQGQSPLQCGELKSDGEKMDPLPSLTIVVVQEIARRCGCKVEFRPAVGTNDDLQVSVEVFFGSEKIGVGMGKSRKDAQQHAAESALISLAGIINDSNSRNGVLTDADAPSTNNEPIFVGTHPVQSCVPVSHAEKPEKFNGLNFKCWQQKMIYYLTTLNLSRFLTEEAPNLEEGERDIQTVNAVVAWKHSDILCRNSVLNCLEDALYDVYSAMETAKELWETLDRKYKIEDEGGKEFKRYNEEFIVGRFLDFKMVDSKPVMSQVHELQVILRDIHAEGMVLSESFQVATIIEKLPPEWEIFKKYLSQERREMNVEELVVRLRIEEDNQNSKKKESNSGVVGAKAIKNGKNSKVNKDLSLSSKADDMERSLSKLVIALKTDESTMKENKLIMLVGSTSGSKIENSKKRNWKGNISFQNNKKTKKDNGKDEAKDICLHCGKLGHGKRNCKDYLAILKC